MYVLLNEPYRFFRYQYKKAVILFNSSFPIEINHEALEILRLCDGTRSVEDIINKIKELYPTDTNVEKYVNDFFKDSYNDEIITFLNKKTKLPKRIIVEGSKDYWSPLHVTMELTHNCPLKCKHCYINAGKGKTMSSDFVEKIVNELIEIGVRSVQLTGGEPFLHHDIVKIIETFNNANVRINITTSGYFYTEGILNAISKIKNGYIQVSLDGLEVTHNIIRGKKDAYTHTIEFIKKIVSLGKKVVIASCYMRQNYEELNSLCNMVKEIGCAGIRFGVVENKGRAKENCSQEEIENYSTLNEILNKLKKTYQDNRFFIDTEEESKINKNVFLNCGAGYNSIKINPVGEVYDCIFSKEPIGKIQQADGLKGFLKSSADFMNNRSNLMAPCKALCGECSELEKCGGCLIKGRESNCKIASLYRDVC